MAVDTQVVDAEQLIVKHLDLWTSAQTAKSTAGRGSNNKIELTGIKKLRELILELAVRGKLVPQDPNDEPASELLKRIEADKNELVKAGKLKKQKLLPVITDDEKPFELPANWKWVRLGNLGWLTSSNRVHQKDWTSQGVPFYRTREIVALNKLDSVDNELFISEELYNELTTTGTTPELNDIMLTGVGTIGVPYVVKKTDKFYFKDASVLIFKNVFKINPSFFLHFFRSPTWINQIHEGSMGTTVHTLTIARGSEILVPVPPVRVQARISEAIDRLMALCDQLEQQSYQSIDAHNQLVDTLLQTLVDSANADELASNWQRLSEHFDTLFTTEYSIDALKQTILQLAVMGKLVKQDPTDEPASELLKRIAKEKEALVKAGKIKKQKPLPPITDDEKPFELPKGWEWCRLAEISSIKGGFAYKSTEFINTGDAQVIRMGNVRPDYFRLDENPVYIDGKYAQLTKDYEVLEGEIVITMTGTKGKRDYLYSVLVEPDDVRQRPLFLNQRLCSVRPVIVVSELLSLVMKDSRLLDMIYAKSTGSANQANIGMEAISNWLIPLPPLNEQNKIIAKFMMLNDICSKLTNRLDKIRSIHYLLADTLVEQVII